LAKFSEMGINVVETKRCGVRKRWRREELEDDERKWKARTS
jgi:Zn ribbon nucleic-acid-binding protein